MNLQEAQKLIGKTVEFKSTFGHKIRSKILKVRQIPNAGVIVAELDDGTYVINIEILHVID